MEKTINEINDKEFANREVSILPKPSKRLPLHAGILCWEVSSDRGSGGNNIRTLKNEKCQRKC